MKPDKNRARGIGFYLLIGVIILAVIFYLTTPAEQKEYTYSEIEELFRQEQVKSFCLEGDELTLNLYSPDSDGNTTIKKTLSNPTWFREDLGDLIEQQTASGVLTEWDEHDYYAFTLTEETEVYMTANSEIQGSQDLTLYDGDMVEIDIVYGLHGYAEERLLPAGTYYIALSGEKGAYTLKVDFGTAGSEKAAMAE